MDQAAGVVLKGKAMRTSLPDELSRIWRFRPDPPHELVDQVTETAGVSPLAARIILQRAGWDPEDAVRFFRCNYALPDFGMLPGLQRAVSRVLEAIRAGERIVIYSDYDADGVTSAAILKEALEFAGCSAASVYFPSRFEEGYGFHPESVAHFARSGASLFITADCGIAALDGCREAARWGSDVIITDHHLPGKALPETYVILDPHLPSWQGHNLRYLSGAGVAYLLAAAVLEAMGLYAYRDGWAHDLIALSIAGDGQPLVGLNRFWVRSGLDALRTSTRPGIRELMKVAGIRPDTGNGLQALSFERDVMFGLVPRINASGRIARADMAYQLLTTRDPVMAAEIAQKLEDLNRERRELEDRILKECADRFEASRYVFCQFEPHWHEGVIGIACARIRERVYRPVVLMGGCQDPLKGSVRGIPGFNVYEALARCSHLLVNFGGHQSAAGFSICRERVPEFTSLFEQVAAEFLREKNMVPSLDIDSAVDLRDLDDQVLRELLSLEPFGQGNPLPVLSCLNSDISQITLMGRECEHLQIQLLSGGESRRFLWFGEGPRARALALAGAVDVAWVPYRSYFNGNMDVCPLIRDVRPAWERSGVGYASLVRSLNSHGRILIYTFSDSAAASVAVAFAKAGRQVAIHKPSMRGAQMHESLVSLGRHGGVVVSTAPWELVEAMMAWGINPGDTTLFLLHMPATQEHACALERLVSSWAGTITVYERWFGDGSDWLRWTFPDKDQMEVAWKFVLSNFGAGSVPLVEVSRRWQDQACGLGLGFERSGFDGARCFLESFLKILEELAIVAYDESRRYPCLSIKKPGRPAVLSDSMYYVAGRRKVAEAAGTWDRFAEGLLRKPVKLLNWGVSS